MADSRAARPGQHILTQTMAAANAVMDRVGRMEPSTYTADNNQWSAVDMLALGHELRLWRYVAVDPGTGAYLVRINDRDRTLLPSEVNGWVLGVLDSVALPIGPFRYREGLE